MAPMRGLCVVAAIATAGSVGTAHADVRIAVAGPITGQYAVFGEQMRRGAELAVKDINGNCSRSTVKAMTVRAPRVWPRGG